MSEGHKLKISAAALPDQLVVGDRVFHIPTGMAVEIMKDHFDGSYSCRFPLGGVVTIQKTQLGGVARD